MVVVGMARAPGGDPVTNITGEAPRRRGAVSERVDHLGPTVAAAVGHGPDVAGELPLEAGERGGHLGVAGVRPRVVGLGSREERVLAGLLVEAGGTVEPGDVGARERL